MHPHMTDAEFTLFASFVRCSDNYLEFGTGGSTYVAAQFVTNHITAVDSSSEWLRDVEQACLGDECRVKPVLVHADIGPTGAWGVPADPATRERWPSYYEAIWENPVSFDADLYLVDGRFRVACFMKTLLNCRPDSLLMIHDFASRQQYHVIREVAREVANAEDFSVFLPVPRLNRLRIHEILALHRYEPA